MVTNTYLPIVGGLEKSIESFTHKFREWGHAVEIAVPNPPFALPLFASLAKVIDVFKPDIIHAHHPFLMGEMALRLSARYEIPLVFTYHILFDQYAHYLPIPAALSRRFLVELAAGYANLSSRVIAPSESVREILIAEGVRSPMDVVPTGVDIAAFDKGDGEKLRRSLGVLPEEFVLGHVGRLAVEKNLHFLSRVVSSFMQTHPKVHFVVAGKGPWIELMEKIFRDAGVQKRFHFLGILQGQALADCYRAMNMFVFASKSETQGMVLCEAMAAGIPVIAIDAPGVREVVRDLRNGRLVRHESESEFSSALQECYEYGACEWKKLKQEARNTAELYSEDICARKALKVYEIALANNRRQTIQEQGEWRRMMRRFRTELKIMGNLGRATGLALKEAVY